MVARGANSRLSPDDLLAEAIAITSAHLVLTQLAVPLGTLLETAKLARRAGSLMVLDAGPARPLPDELLSHFDLVRANPVEAQTLTGVEVVGRASARTAAQTLLERGAGMAVVQAGEEGDLVLLDDEEVWLPRIEAHSIDKTGAGDAFVAAMATALVGRYSGAQAGKFGSAAAALATTVFGARAGLPRREAILALLESTDANAQGPAAA